MISVELAAALRLAGLRWDPAPGDRFTIRQPAFDGDVFTVSEMTIQVHEFPTGTILGFNGTTEWALDSVMKDDALWLPGEDQLRGLLGAAFVSLRSTTGGFAVTTAAGDGPDTVFEAPTAHDAYARALLALMTYASS